MKLLFSLLCGGLSLVLLPVCGQSPVAPKLLPFQGRLIDSGGKPVADGVRLVQFQIYSDPVGGSVLWAGELHRTTINGGLVNVLLGSKNALPENRADQLDKSFFQQPLFLQITIDANNDSQINADDPPLLPRQVVVPVIFAHEAGNARTLNGYDWTTVFGTSDPAKGFMSGERIQSGTLPEDRLPQGTVVPKGGMIVATNATPPPGFVATGRVLVSPPVTTVGVGSSYNRYGPNCVSTDTHIYLFGGYLSYDSNNNPVPSALTDRYDLAQNTWEPLPDMPVARVNAFGVNSGGQIYAVGGLAAGNTISTRVDAFNPSSNQWTLKTQLPDTRLNAGAGADGDYIYVFGGITTAQFDPTKLLDSAYRYSIRSNQWEALPNMPRARSFTFRGQVLKINGRFYAFGGDTPINQALSFDKIDIYDIATRKWTEMAGAQNLSGLTVARNSLIYCFVPFGPSITEFDPVTGRLRQFSRPNFQTGNPQAMLALGSGFLVFTDGQARAYRYTPESFDIVPDLNIFVRP